MGIIPSLWRGRTLKCVLLELPEFVLEALLCSTPPLLPHMLTQPVFMKGAECVGSSAAVTKILNQNLQPRSKGSSAAVRKVPSRG